VASAPVRSRQIARSARQSRRSQKARGVSISSLSKYRTTTVIERANSHCGVHHQGVHNRDASVTQSLLFLFGNKHGLLIIKDEPDSKK
jgi:hypothetical protein